MSSVNARRFSEETRASLHHLVHLWALFFLHIPSSSFFISFAAEICSVQMEKCENDGWRFVASVMCPLFFVSREPWEKNESRCEVKARLHTELQKKQRRDLFISSPLMCTNTNAHRAFTDSARLSPQLEAEVDVQEAQLTGGSGEVAVCRTTVEHVRFLYPSLEHLYGTAARSRFWFYFVLRKHRPAWPIYQDVTELKTAVGLFFFFLEESRRHQASPWWESKFRVIKIQNLRPRTQKNSSETICVFLSCAFFNSRGGGT